MQHVEHDDVQLPGAPAPGLEDDPVDAEQALREPRQARSLQHEGQAVDEAADGVRSPHRVPSRRRQSPDAIARAARTSPV